MVRYERIKMCSDCQILKDRIEELEELIGQGKQQWHKYAIKFKLTPTEAKIFSYIATHKFSNETNLIIALYGNLNPPSSNGIRVLVYRIRQKLSEYKLTIQSKAYIGYWMDDTDKLKLNKLMEE